MSLFFEMVVILPEWTYRVKELSNELVALCHTLGFSDGDPEVRIIISKIEVVRGDNHLIPCHTT